ncbi:MAG: S-methyl-5'-thioinosine phosphorylase [Pseudomonadota bacterium]|nr:S-methyl-5'-thioinosine phosphorylase [Pseudomonadota bacterium]
MSELAIIGGTGLRTLSGLEIARRVVMQTPYGEPSCPFVYGIYCGKEVVFMARHGVAHAIPPHQVNYRANLWALKHLGIHHVISINAVGGIHPDLAPGRIAFPHQIIDYTWSRPHTFFEGRMNQVTHIDFTEPYCETLRGVLIGAAEQAGLEAWPRGVYGASQGPRLETAAEIDRMARDGCDMVGMTGMPEAALARELGMCYASCAVVANWAAGRGEGVLTIGLIESNVKVGMHKVRRLLEHAIPLV